ncbi:MAG: inorganic diphosphatase [Candidatus Malihini olakiniferum]
MPQIEQQSLKAFFRVYRQLLEGHKIVELKGTEDAAVAKAIIAATHKKYRATHNSQAIFK